MNGVGRMRVPAEQPVKRAKADKAEGGNAQAHDRTAVESHREGNSRTTFSGSGSGTYIGLGRRKHTQVPRQR